MDLLFPDVVFDDLQNVVQESFAGFGFDRQFSLVDALDDMAKSKIPYDNVFIFYAVPTC